MPQVKLTIIRSEKRELVLGGEDGAAELAVVAAYSAADADRPRAACA